MVKDLIHDPILLARKSEDAGPEDMEAANDLRDTLLAHSDECVGMAANMIGVFKRIIVFECEGKPVLMFNPEIIKAAGPYETEEACLSLLGGPRKTRRYREIKLSFLNEKLQKRIKNYSGFTAQIIQHEIDHLNGVLI